MQTNPTRHGWLALRVLLFQPNSLKTEAKLMIVLNDKILNNTCGTSPFGSSDTDTQE